MKETTFYVISRNRGTYRDYLYKAGGVLYDKDIHRAEKFHSKQDALDACELKSGIITEISTVTMIIDTSMVTDVEKEETWKRQALKKLSSEERKALHLE